MDSPVSVETLLEERGHDTITDNIELGQHTQDISSQREPTSATVTTPSIAAAETPDSISKLPPEILFCIFKFLDIDESVCLGLTNKRLYTIHWTKYSAIGLRVYACWPYVDTNAYIGFKRPYVFTYGSHPSSSKTSLHRLLKEWMLQGNWDFDSRLARRVERKFSRPIWGIYLRYKTQDGVCKEKVMNGSNWEELMGRYSRRGYVHCGPTLSEEESTTDDFSESESSLSES